MAASKEDLQRQVGVRIFNRRTQLDMTQAELAIQADLPYKSISDIEAGRRNVRLDTLTRIAAALKVPLSALQPEELDTFNEVTPEMSDLIQQLKALPVHQQSMLLKMFQAQITSLG